MPKIGDTQFTCCHTSLARIKKEAEEAGWDPEGGDQPGDYTDVGMDQEQVFASKDAAVKWGSEYCKDGKDYWGTVIVYQEKYEEDEEAPGLKNWVKVYRWEVDQDGIGYQCSC